MEIMGFEPTAFRMRTERSPTELYPLDGRYFTSFPLRMQEEVKIHFEYDLMQYG